MSNSLCDSFYFHHKFSWLILFTDHVLFLFSRSKEANRSKRKASGSYLSFLMIQALLTVFNIIAFSFCLFSLPAVWLPSYSVYKRDSFSTYWKNMTCFLAYVLLNAFKLLFCCSILLSIKIFCVFKPSF